MEHVDQCKETNRPKNADLFHKPVLIYATNADLCKDIESHLELIRCCKRNDLTIGLASIPKLGNGEKAFVSVNSSPIAYRMSISNTSGSNLAISSPKQNTETISMKNALQR